MEKEEKIKSVGSINTWLPVPLGAVLTILAPFFLCPTFPYLTLKGGDVTLLTWMDLNTLRLHLVFGAGVNDHAIQAASKCNLWTTCQVCVDRQVLDSLSSLAVCLMFQQSKINIRLMPHYIILMDAAKQFLTYSRYWRGFGPPKSSDRLFCTL